MPALHYLAYKLTTRLYQSNVVRKPYTKNFHLTQNKFEYTSFEYTFFYKNFTLRHFCK